MIKGEISDRKYDEMYTSSESILFPLFYFMFICKCFKLNSFPFSLFILFNICQFTYKINCFWLSRFPESDLFSLAPLKSLSTLPDSHLCLAAYILPFQLSLRAIPLSLNST